MGQQLPYGHGVLTGACEFGPILCDGCVVIDQPAFDKTVQDRTGDAFSGGERHGHGVRLPAGISGRPPGPDIDDRFPSQIYRQCAAAAGGALEEAKELCGQLTEPWIDEHDAWSGPNRGLC
ncbi:hypothetical protein N806_14625 [Rhodococcus sp. P27]|nr:hypothetical protein N806_14625 [Rhodococcus sp. P27]